MRGFEPFLATKIKSKPQLKNERFEVESGISVGDCDQTEILVSTFDSSSGPGRLPRYVDVSNVLTSISVWSQSPTEMPTLDLKTFVFLLGSLLFIYDTFLDQGSRSERYLQIKAHFEV